jgi:hypothetical protein
MSVGGFDRTSPREVLGIAIRFSDRKFGCKPLLQWPALIIFLKKRPDVRSWLYNQVGG